VQSVADLYTLGEGQVAKLERMGKRSAKNLVNALEASKSRDLSRLLFALGIRGIGQRSAQLLAQRFGEMDGVMSATAEEIAGIEGYGEIMAQSVVDFFALEQNRRLIERLKELGLNMRCDTVPAAGTLSGKTFVLTGTLPTLSRSEAKAMIEAVGQKDRLCGSRGRGGQQTHQSERIGDSGNRRRRAARHDRKRRGFPC